MESNMRSDTHKEEERLRFWVDFMDRMDSLVEEVVAYPFEECGEGLASIPDAFEEAGVEALFSDTKIDGELDRIYWIRESLIPRLVAIAQEMNERCWILKIEDAFRTLEMQTRLGRSEETFDRIVHTCLRECRGAPPPIDLLYRRARVLVANHPKSGTHMLGAAVDISVFRREDGSEVSRGKQYLEMSEYTAMDSPFVSESERANRLAITEIMERHGFMHFPGEFWHYNHGDALYQILVASGRPGIYGPIHWDQATGEVTPFEDPMMFLTSLDELERCMAAALERLNP